MDYKSHRSLIKAAIQSKRRSILTEKIDPNIDPTLLGPRNFEQTSDLNQASKDQEQRIKATSLFQQEADRQERARDIDLLHLNPQRTDVIYNIALGKEVDLSKLKTLSPEIEKEYQTPTIFPTGQDGRMVAGSDPRYAEGLLRELGQLSRGEEALINSIRSGKANADYYGTGYQYEQDVLKSMGPVVAATALKWKARSPTVNQIGGELKKGARIEDLVGEEYKFNTNWLDEFVAANPDLNNEDMLRSVLGTLPDRTKVDKDRRQALSSYIDTREKRRKADSKLALSEIMGSLDEGKTRLDPITGKMVSVKRDLIPERTNLPTYLEKLKYESGFESIGIPGSATASRINAPSGGTPLDFNLALKQLGDVTYDKANKQLTVKSENFEFKIGENNKGQFELLDTNQISSTDPQYSIFLRSKRPIDDAVKNLNRLVKKYATPEIEARIASLQELVSKDIDETMRGYRDASSIPRRNPPIDTTIKPAFIGSQSDAVRDYILSRLETSNLDELIAQHESTDPNMISSRRNVIKSNLSDFQYTNLQFDKNGNLLGIRGDETPLQQARKIIELGRGYTEDAGKVSARRATLRSSYDPLNLTGVNPRGMFDLSDLDYAETPTKPLDIGAFIEGRVLEFDPSTKQYKFNTTGLGGQQFEADRPLSAFGPKFEIETQGVPESHAQMLRQIRQQYGLAPEQGKLNQRISKAIGIAKMIAPTISGIATSIGAGAILDTVGNFQSMPQSVKSGLQYGASGTVSDIVGEALKGRYRNAPFFDLTNLRGSKLTRSLVRGGIPTALEGIAMDYISDALGTKNDPYASAAGSLGGLASVPITANLSRPLLSSPHLGAKVAGVALNALGPTAVDVGIQAAFAPFQPRDLTSFPTATRLKSKNPEFPIDQLPDATLKQLEAVRRTYLDQQHIFIPEMNEAQPDEKGFVAFMEKKGYRPGTYLSPSSIMDRPKLKNDEWQKMMDATMEYYADLMSKQSTPKINESWYPNPRFR